MNTGFTTAPTLTPRYGLLAKTATSTRFCFARLVGTDRDEAGTGRNVAKRSDALSSSPEGDR